MKIEHKPRGHTLDQSNLKEALAILKTDFHNRTQNVCFQYFEYGQHVHLCNSPVDDERMAKPH